MALHWVYPTWLKRELNCSWCTRAALRSPQPDQASAGVEPQYVLKNRAARLNMHIITVD